jgi:Fe-S cluster assembly scaffold protein SufB
MEAEMIGRRVLVKDVLQQLAMECAVEAQKLISISLEGSVE